MATQLERMAVVETVVKQLGDDIRDVREHQTSNHVELSSKIDALTKAVNGKLNEHEDRLAKAEETLEPLTKFRKRIWQMIVFAAFGAAFVAIIFWEIQRFKAN